MGELSLDNVGHVVEEGGLIVCGAQRLELGGCVSSGYGYLIKYNSDVTSFLLVSGS